MSPRFRTDKEEPHGYLPDYLQLAEIAGPAAVVCEVGVLHGDSLDMWRELFPAGTVIGVDRDPGCRWPPGTHRVLAAQDDPGLAAMVTACAPGGCDLIVDDASHIGHLTAAAFTSLWPLVKPGGFYVVEDWADPWVSPELLRWSQVDPVYEGDELVDYVPSLITALRDGAADHPAPAWPAGPPAGRARPAVAAGIRHAPVPGQHGPARGGQLREVAGPDGGVAGRVHLVHRR